METEQIWAFEDEFFQSEEDPKEVEKKKQRWKQYVRKLVTNPYYVAFLQREYKIEPLQKPKSISAMFLFTPRPRSRREIAEIDSSELTMRQTGALFFVEAWIRSFSPIWTVLIWGGKQYMERFINSNKLNKDYLPGVLFLYRWILLDIYLSKGKTPPRSNPEDYNGQKEFDELPDLSKAIVHGAIAMYLSVYKRENGVASQGSLEAMGKAVHLDPTSFEWHYQYGNWLRHQRKQEGTNSNQPTDEELQIFWETYHVCDYAREEEDEDDPSISKPTYIYRLAIAGITQAVAELLGYRSFKNIQVPVTVGELTFHSNVEMKEFVIDNVKRMMSWEKPCFGEFIRCGEILSNILPHQFRDYQAAEEHYLKAWKIWPTNSKINHKLGVIYVVSDELQDIEKAIKFLTAAVILEESNIPALMDLIQTLMSDPVTNEDRLNELVCQRLNQKTYLQRKDRIQLHFINGCLKYMTGRKKDAVEEWISAYQMHLQHFNDFSNVFLFQKVGSTLRRYRWPKHLFSFPEIRGVLNDFVVKSNPTSLLEKREALSAIMDHISQQMEREKPKRFADQQTHQRSFGRLVSDSDDNWRRGSGNGNGSNVTPESQPLEQSLPRTKSNRYVPPNRRSSTYSNPDLQNSWR